MARDHGRIMCSIWDDREFLKLDAAVQRTYFLLISEPSISNAGVMMLTLRRWARLAADTPIEVLEDHIRVLSDCRFLVVDWDTEELLVRSFIRNDGVVKQPHILLNAIRSVRHLRSPVLRVAVGRELARVGATGLVLPKYMGEVEHIIGSLQPETGPNPAGNPALEPIPGTPTPSWSSGIDRNTRSAANVGEATEPFPEGFREGLYEGFGEGFGEPYGEGEGEVGISSFVVTHLSSKERGGRKPKIAKQTIDKHFATFWAAYPRREAKKAAYDKFARLIRDGIPPETLISGARRYAASLAKAGREREKTKIPTTWLNQGCWDDEYDQADTTTAEVQDDPKAWLLRQWEAATVSEIGKRTSFRYQVPDLPRGIAPSEAEKWHFDHRREWIKTNNEAIIAELKGLACTA